MNDNEYTFTMPVGKVSVDATFVQKDAADDSNAAEAGKTIKLQIGSRIVNVDNEAVIYDAAPVIRNDRTLVPIRIITEALGGKVDWNGATKEVTLSINDKEIKMTIGKTLENMALHLLSSTDVPSYPCASWQMSLAQTSLGTMQPKQ